jgi:hypothetical protein
VSGTAIVIAAVVAAFVAAPVAAGGSHQPDGWARYYKFHSGSGTNTVDPGPWAGKNVYNLTATNQVAKRRFIGATLEGDYFEFQVAIQNDGSADRFRVRAPESFSTTKYLHGSTNITSAVVNGTFQTPLLASGEIYRIKVRIDGGDQPVELTSVADPAKTDVVRVKVKFECGC